MSKLSDTLDFINNLEPNLPDTIFDFKNYVTIELAQDYLIKVVPSEFHKDSLNELIKFVRKSESIEIIKTIPNEIYLFKVGNSIAVFHKYNNDFILDIWCGPVKITEIRCFKLDVGNLKVELNPELIKLIKLTHPELETDDIQQLHSEPIFFTIIACLVLIKFSKIDVEFIPIFKSERSNKGIVKKLTRSKFKLLRITDSVFKEIHYTGKFKVRGHFRFQPYGPRSNPSHKLIWIKDHVRSGYTRKIPESIKSIKSNQL
jgi:hypothetical protein